MIDTIFSISVNETTDSDVSIGNIRIRSFSQGAVCGGMTEREKGECFHAQDQISLSVHRVNPLWLRK